MNNDTCTFKVGTRRSELALKQTAIVVSALREKFPNHQYEIVALSTRGDEILDSALPLMGGKNLFTMELEKELLAHKIDMIVHSLKDLATEIQPNTSIGAVLKRDSRHDVVVMRKCSPYKSLDELPSGSIVGTSSLRRISLLKYLYPHLNVKNIRGNLNTRLKKLDCEQSPQYAAIILAAAGIERLNLNERINQHLLPNHWPYAVSQGIIAIQCRSNDYNIINTLKSITHTETLMEAIMERAMMRTLKGGCSVPIGVDALVEINAQTISITMKGFIYCLQPQKPPLTACYSGTLSVDSRSCNEPLPHATADEVYECINVHERIVTTDGCDCMEKLSEIGQQTAQQLLQNNAIQYIETAKKTLAEMNF